MSDVAAGRCWRTVVASAILAVAAMTPGWASDRTTTEIGQDAHWCAVLNTLGPGQKLVLHTGDYTGPCTVRRGGTVEAPLVIRAKDPSQRPRLVYTGWDSNVLNVRAGHVVIRDLRFGPTRPNIDGVRIYEGDGVTVEDCSSRISGASPWWRTRRAYGGSRYAGTRSCGPGRPRCTSAVTTG